MSRRRQPGPRRLAAFTVASTVGNERVALARVAAAVSACGLSPAQLERLKTAVAETTMNAIEHGNGGDPSLPVAVVVDQDGDGLVVTVTDEARHGSTTAAAAEVPDLDAKLAGLQSPRGWGLFLIRQMVDRVEEATEGTRHVVRLIVHPGDGTGTAEARL